MRFLKIRNHSIVLILVLLSVSAFLANANFKDSGDYSSISSYNSTIEDSLLFDSIPIEVVSGQYIFNVACQQCHRSHISHYRNSEQWTQIVSRMGIKAQLSDSAVANVDAFVQWKLERTDSSYITPVYVMGGNQW